MFQWFHSRLSPVLLRQQLVLLRWTQRGVTQRNWTQVLQFVSAGDIYSVDFHTEPGRCDATIFFLYDGMMLLRCYLYWGWFGE